MAYIQVDVDLSEFGTDEIISEAADRISLVRIAKLSERQKRHLKNSVQELATVLGVKTTEGITINTIEDQMKFDHLVKVFNKYSISDFEAMIPE